MSDNPIEITGLSKVYGGFTAVDNLTLSIKKNSFTGLLGPNGAGKSTTLKIITNLIRKTSGSVYLNGIDVTTNPKEALMGVGTVVETPEFYLYLTPRESMQYIGKLIGMTNESIAAETDEILHTMKMSEWADNKLGTFSKGMRQRIAIGQALLNSPSIIFLDEPTSGLDPRGMAETRDILKSLKTRDLTILMSSHLLNEVSDLCDRVAMINHGKLLVHDDFDKITAHDGNRVIKAKVTSDISQEMLERIRAIPNVQSAENFGGEIDIRIIGGNTEQAQLLSSLYSMDLGLYNLSGDERMLEAKYLDLIKETR